LARHYAQNPDATLIAGATDIGLWVTKGLRDIAHPVFLADCTDLQQTGGRAITSASAPG
jgi:xanthine dehydrogenase small subunit